MKFLAALRTVLRRRHERYTPLPASVPGEPLPFDQRAMSKEVFEEVAKEYGYSFEFWVKGDGYIYRFIKLGEGQELPENREVW